MGVKDLKDNALSLVVLGVVVLMGLAVIQGFQNTNLVDNATATSFITGLGYFGTFAGIIAIALVGVGIISMFIKKKGGGMDL